MINCTGIMATSHMPMVSETLQINALTQIFIKYLILITVGVALHQYQVRNFKKELDESKKQIDKLQSELYAKEAQIQGLRDILRETIF